MPRSVRIAVVAMGVIAALLLVNAGLSWYSRARLAAAVVDARPNLSRASAEHLVLLWMLPYLILGVVLALSAWFLPRGHAWARWIGLAAATLLGLLTLFSVLTSGGITAASLLLIVLSGTAVVTLTSRATSAWVEGLRAPR
jgi:hypothetical protein